MRAPCFPISQDNIVPAERRKRRINKRRHWQCWNNYTPLLPIYINKHSLGKRESMLTVMVKIIFQAVAHHVLKRVYGCERVLHCRWNIWFSLARPRPVTHYAGLMQSVCPGVTLTIHLWPTAHGPQQNSPLSIIRWSIFLCFLMYRVIIVIKDTTGPEGSIQARVLK